VIGVALIKVFAFAAVGLVGLVGVIGQARRRAAVRAKIHAAPSTFEDNAAVTFTGTVKLLGVPLTAPLTGKTCVAYRAVARTYTGSGRRTSLEHEVADAAMVPFVLVTKTGEVLVDGETCQLVEPGEPIIPRKLDLEEKFLASQGLAGRARKAGFDEARVEIGAKITVHGVSRQELAEHGGESGFREAPTQIRLTGDDAHPLTIDHA
jgi:hypothetical protein